MAPRYVNVDRDTPMLFPPDMRDWVRKDGMVHFVIEAVEQMDLRMAQVNVRGSGSEQYPPAMMTALLIYCYAHGIFSSRKIETATYRDVAVRYLTGDTHPDHDTIASFRRRNRQLFEQAEQVDGSESDAGDRLPEQLARHGKLKQKLARAKSVLQERAKAVAEQPAYEAKVEARNKRQGRSKGCLIKPALRSTVRWGRSESITSLDTTSNPRKRKTRPQ